MRYPCRLDLAARLIALVFTLSACGATDDLALRTAIASPPPLLSLTSAAIPMPAPTLASRSLIASSTPPTASPIDPAQLLQLASAQRRWLDSGITDYRMTVQRMGFGYSPPLTLEVRKGVVVPSLPFCVPPLIVPNCTYDHAEDDTVPGLFALALRVVSDADLVIQTWEFDPGDGHPTAIAYQSVRPLTDNGVQWSVTAFTRLP